MWRDLETWICPALSMVSSIIKIVGGLVSGSIALLADGLDSLINILSSTIAYAFYSISIKPPDRDHPYGHYGFEILSVIITSIIMLFVAAIIVSTVFTKSVSRVRSEGILYSLISTIILVAITFYTLLYSKKARSIALRAEARHLSIDLVESLLVLLGVVLAVYFNPLFDLITAALVASLMVAGALFNMKSIIDSILLTAPPRFLEDKIRLLTMKVNGVVSCHNIRMRRVGEKIFLDLHVTVEDYMSIKSAHEISHKVEEIIKENIPEIVDVVIHVEPSTG